MIVMYRRLNKQREHIYKFSGIDEGNIPRL